MTSLAQCTLLPQPAGHTAPVKHGLRAEARGRAQRGRAQRGTRAFQVLFVLVLSLFVGGEFELNASEPRGHDRVTSLGAESEHYDAGVPRKPTATALLDKAAGDRAPGRTQSTSGLTELSLVSRRQGQRVRLTSPLVALRWAPRSPLHWRRPPSRAPPLG